MKKIIVLSLIALSTICFNVNAAEIVKTGSIISFNGIPYLSDNSAERLR